MNEERIKCQNLNKKEKKIDLHYLHKDEAIKYLEVCVKKRNCDRLVVITGSSLSSKILRPAVIEYAEKRNIDYIIGVGFIELVFKG